MTNEFAALFEPSPRRSRVEELLDMIERKAPYLMRVGQSFTREINWRGRLSCAERQRIVDLYAARSRNVRPNTAASRAMMQGIADDLGLHYDTIVRCTRPLRNAIPRIGATHQFTPKHT